MRVLRLRREVHATCGPRGGAAVYHCRKRLILNPDEELGLRAHRLHHDHFGADARRCELEVPGPDAVFPARSTGAW